MNNSDTSEEEGSMLTEYSSPSYSSKSSGDSLFPYQLMQRQLEGLFLYMLTVCP